MQRAASPFIRALHIAVLTAFAVAQPLFDLLGRHVEFLLAHGLDGLDLVGIAAVLGLGVPGAFYHFAFEAGSPDALNNKREELIGKGVMVTDVVDHEWAQSIYFLDPNGISLEFCYLTRDIGTEDDVTMQERAEVSIERCLGDNYINARVSSKVEEPALADA